MILSDVFQRFAQDSPVCVMAQALMENALPPRSSTTSSRTCAERSTRADLLFSDVVDLMSLVVCRIRPSINSAFKKMAETVWASPARRSTTSSTGSRPSTSAALVRHSRRGLGAGHRRDRRPRGSLAAGLPRPDPRRQPPPRDRAPDQGAADDPRRGLARPGAGRARPRADAGHRRGPLRGRPRPGAVAAGQILELVRPERPLDRRPQLLHDGLPLRDRRPRRRPS